MIGSGRQSAVVLRAIDPQAARVRVAPLAAAFFLLVSWAFACSAAWAQSSYAELPVSEAIATNKRTESEIRGLVAKILAGGEPLEPNRARFEGWYRLYLFPQLTKLDAIGKAAEVRLNIQKYDLGNAKSEEARQALVKLTFDEMKKILAGNFHPGARYNAMLLIADLNATEAVQGSPTTARPPRPYPGSLSVILDEWKKPDVSDAMLVACLVGARRHVDVDRVLAEDQKMDAASRKTIYDRSLAVLTAEKPEARKPLPHAYVQLLAADLIGILGEPGAGGEAAKALEKIVADPTAPDFLRSGAMTSLGKMNLPQQAYAAETPNLLRSFADASFGFLLHEIEALKTEKQYRVDFVAKPVVNSGYGGGGYMPDSSEMMGASGYELSGSEYGGYGGYGPGGMTAPDPNKPKPGPLAVERDYMLENSRRRLKAYLVDAQRALRGRSLQTPDGIAKLATKPEEKEIVKAIDDQIDDVVATADDAELTIDQMIEKFTTHAASMQNALALSAPQPATGPAGTTVEPAAPRGPGRGPGGRGPGPAPGPGPATPAPAAPGPAVPSPTAPADAAETEASTPVTPAPDASSE